jgi:hypothetical protein
MRYEILMTVVIADSIVSWGVAYFSEERFRSVFHVNCTLNEVRDYFVSSMSFVENEFVHFVKLK